jgi:DNA-binding GntR family transcriptional regulator
MGTGAELQQESPFSSLGKPERQFLYDQATKLLRDAIISGQIRPGTKATERDLAQWSGISRGPARDALLRLETEGLVLNRGAGRYVLELNEHDIRELYDVRRALEHLAVQGATCRVSPESRALLSAGLEEMREAVSKDDPIAHIESDVKTHQLVWKQAGNSYLARTLDVIAGPTFAFVSASARQFHDWEQTLAAHEELVAAINLGNAEEAVIAMDAHLDHAFQRTQDILNRLSLTAQHRLAHSTVS